MRNFPWFYTALSILYFKWLSYSDILVKMVNIQEPQRSLFVGISVFVFTMLPWHFYGFLQNYMDSRPEAAWGKYKVHRRDKLSYKDMLPTVLFNQFVYFLPVTLVSGFLGRGLRLQESPPLVSELFLHTVSLYLIYEIIFYFAHRVLHLPTFYEKFHKLHHQTFGSVGISGQYATGLDFALMQWIPGLCGAVLLDSHVASVWFFTMIGSFNSIHSHGGYNFPGFPNPHEHGEHHSKIHLCYGTGPLDALLHTGLNSTKESKKN